jgi:hypothetical protein
VNFIYINRGIDQLRWDLFHMFSSGVTDVDMQFTRIVVADDLL